MARKRGGRKRRTQGSTLELACHVLARILSYLPLIQRLGAPAVVSKSFHTACMKSLTGEERVSFLRKSSGGKRFDEATRCWVKYACVPPRIRIANPSDIHLHALSRCGSNIRGLSLASMNPQMLSAIPEALACLSCLEKLSIAVENESQKHLNINTITIPHLPQLTSLAVSYTDLKNLYGLENLPQLSVLKIGCDSLENVSWPSDLLELYAYVSKCSSSVATSLVKKLTKLTHLGGDHMLADILSHSHAPFYPTLRDCSSDAATLSTDILRNMEHMTNLHVLSLSGAANLTPAGVCSIARIVSLQELYLAADIFTNAPVGDADLAPLRQLVNLEILEIFNFTDLTSAFLSSIASLPRLRTLKLRFCSGIKSLAPLQACRCLTYLIPPDLVSEENALEISRITTLETVWDCHLES